MKWYVWLIIVVVVAVGLFLTGWFTRGCGGEPEKVIYKWKTKTVTEYIKVPGSCDEYKACYKAPIEIYGAQVGEDYDITATDGCKAATRKLWVDIKCPVKRHVITISPILGVSWDNKIMTVQYGARLNYYYKLTNLFGIGGGISGTNKGAGVDAGILLNF